MLYKTFSHCFRSLFVLQKYMSALTPSKTSGINKASNIFAKVCFAIFALTLTASTDSLQSRRISEITQRQKLMIKLSMNHNMRLHVRGDTGDISDVCTWEKIECSNGMVTSLQAVDHVGHTHVMQSVQIEWLPPTLQFVHLHTISVPYLWSTMSLPRDLRYLYLRFCDDLTVQPNRIDFARLPPKMEELIVIDSSIGGTICFGYLPETMRFLVFRFLPNMPNGIVVNYGDIPGALERLHVSAYGDFAFDPIEIGEPNGVKLQTIYDSNILLEGSKYAPRFEKKVDLVV